MGFSQRLAQQVQQEIDLIIDAGIKRRLNGNVSVTQIAEEFGFTRPGLYRRMKRLNLSRQRSRQAQFAVVPVETIRSTAYTDQSGDTESTENESPEEDMNVPGIIIVPEVVIPSRRLLQYTALEEAVDLENETPDFDELHEFNAHCSRTLPLLLLTAEIEGETPLIRPEPFSPEHFDSFFTKRNRHKNYRRERTRDTSNLEEFVVRGMRLPQFKRLPFAAVAPSQKISTSNYSFQGHLQVTVDCDSMIYIGNIY